MHLSLLEIGSLITAAVSVGGVAVSFINARTANRKVRIDSVSAEAAADLSHAQVQSQIIDDLREHVESLRNEIAELRSTIQRFEDVIRTLPTEQQALFAARAKSRPKAGSGDSGI